ncbi:hypothetical protein AB6N24_13050 [Cellulomonas sp. 179-A 4D5 NHS]|uniref:hypothetical protein n=1 Tax=Cellulomonas sp. 179-A 4D5 NHS TaxID=3142378 RepID=UPI00399F0706
MTGYTIEPEVAGGLGVRTVIDASVDPPRVDHLDYELAGWQGDDIVEAFPCFAVTSALGDSLRAAHVTGFSLAEMTVSTTPEFDERHRSPLPTFHWLRVTGRAGVDDLWIGDDLVLRASERAYAVLAGAHLAHAVVERSA